MPYALARIIDYSRLVVFCQLKWSATDDNNNHDASDAIKLDAKRYSSFTDYMARSQYHAAQHNVSVSVSVSCDVVVSVDVSQVPRIESVELEPRAEKKQKKTPRRRK